LLRKSWQWCKILSTRVVLPWSTWAMMAIFRIGVMRQLKSAAKVRLSLDHRPF